ncbi:MAG: hydrogenase maturation protease [Candidatus Zixiibacteriota bacterium]
MATLVIGIGNRHRRDDGVGVVVTSFLSDLDGPGLRIISTDSADVGLVDRWSADDTVFVVDAASGDDPPGTIHRFDATAASLPAQMRGSPSTHVLGLGEAIALARVLNRLPRQLIVYAIVGGDFGYGGGLTTAVQDAAAEVARRIRCEAAARLRESMKQQREED